MESESDIPPEDEKIQLEYLESLLTNLTTKNIGKVVRKIKNIQFKTRSQLQHLSDLIFKFVHQRPDKIKEYAYLCGQIKDLKVTILRFETVDEKESLEIANLRFHILLTTRVEIGYDQLGAVKDSFEIFSKQKQNGSLIEVLRFVKNQMTFAGELYKHDLVTTEFLFAAINRLSLMASMSEFFLECMISLMEQVAKDVEAHNYSLGRYFKQLKHIARCKDADIVLKERIQDLLKLRATKWLGGEEEVPLEYVENIIIDENYKQKSLKSIEEELTKYISLDRCTSCCIEFKPSDRINHLTSKQHTTSMQTLLRDQYDGNLISCRERSCIICQDVDIERPFVHFNTQKHKINSTTFCYICQTKFKSAFYLSMHLKSLNHRKEILRMYDSILGTTLLSELISKENDILGSDASDDNDENIPVDYERYDDNATLKNNIFKYINLITSEEITKDEQSLHDLVMEQLDKFIENIYISKNISIENTLELLKQFNQEVEDVKAAVKCVTGQFPSVSAAERKGTEQDEVVEILKDQYAELCEKMQKRIAELGKMKTEKEFQSGKKFLVQESYATNDDSAAVDDSKGNHSKEKIQGGYLIEKAEESANVPEELPKGSDTKNTKSEETNRYAMQNTVGPTRDTSSEQNKTKSNLKFLAKPQTNLQTLSHPESDSIKCPEKENREDAFSTVQLNIELTTENVNLTQRTTEKAISENKITNKNKTTRTEFKNELDKTTKEKHEVCDTKTSNVKTSTKHKRAKNKNKTSETYSKIKAAPEEKCKPNNCESKLTGTTKWHVVDHSIKNFNHQIECNIQQDDTNIQKLIKQNSDVDQKNPNVNTQNKFHMVRKKYKTRTENVISYYSINHEVTGFGTPNNVCSTTVEIGSYSDNASNVTQHNKGTISRNKNTPEDIHFDLEKTKNKMFGRLTGKISEMLRTGDRSANQSSDEEKVAIEVTSVIKNVYMSDDFPIGLTLGLFENFNRDMEVKIKELERCKRNCIDKI